MISSGIMLVTSMLFLPVLMIGMVIWGMRQDGVAGTAGIVATTVAVDGALGPAASGTDGDCGGMSCGAG